MRLILQNTSILTLDNADAFYYPGYIEIREDVIYEVGPWDEGKVYGEYEGETRVVDGMDRLVMPGLVDLHFHTSVAKGYGDSLPLWEYLDKIWYPSIRSLSPSDAKTAALYSYTTALKSGTTTVNDMYRHLPSLCSAALETGIRAVLSNDIALPEHHLDSVEDNIQAFRKCDGKGDGRIRVWMGLEWMPLADENLLRDIAKERERLGTGLHIHLHESLSEISSCIKRFGKRPVQLLHEAGLLGPFCIAAHAVHLLPEEIQLLADTGTHISHNAGSNAKLGNGVARLGEMVERGVNVGLGVDACECHNSVDMFETMKITSFMQRAFHQDSTLCPPSHILRMATGNGARALGVNAGVLEKGRKADVIMLDLRKDMMFTPLAKGKERKEMLESHLVFGCNGTAVEMVVVDGRVVVEERRVLGVDEDGVRRDMDELFEVLVGRMPGVTEEREKEG